MSGVVGEQDHYYVNMEDDVVRGSIILKEVSGRPTYTGGAPTPTPSPNPNDVVRGSIILKGVSGRPTYTGGADPNPKSKP